MQLTTNDFDCDDSNLFCFQCKHKTYFIKVLTDKQWVVMEAFPFVIMYNQPLLFSLVVFLKKWA
jgi:hypothetical protein